MKIEDIVDISQISDQEAIDLYKSNLPEDPDKVWLVLAQSPPNSYSWNQLISEMEQKTSLGETIIEAAKYSLAITRKKDKA